MVSTGIWRRLVVMGRCKGSEKRRNTDLPTAKGILRIQIPYREKVLGKYASC